MFGILQTSIKLYETISKFLNGERDLRDEALDELLVKGQNVVSVNKQTLFRPLILVSNTLSYTDISTLKTVIKTELNVYIALHIRAIQNLINLNGVNPGLAIFRVNTGLNNDDFKSYVTAGLEKDPMGSKFDKSKLLEDALIQTFELELNNTVVDPVTKEKVTRVVRIPIVFYPVIRFVDIPELIEDLANGRTPDKSFKERWLDYRSGAISLSDLIFASDLVREYKAKRIKNNNDVAELIRKTLKVRGFEQLLTVRSKYKPRFIAYVCSIEDKMYLDKAVRGNIFQDKYKDMIMSLLFALEIGLLDIDQNKLTLMVDGLSGFSVYDLDMLKTKGNDVDINEIFKNILVSKPPF